MHDDAMVAPSDASVVVARSQMITGMLGDW